MGEDQRELDHNTDGKGVLPGGHSDWLTATEVLAYLGMNPDDEFIVYGWFKRPKHPLRSVKWQFGKRSRWTRLSWLMDWLKTEKLDMPTTPPGLLKAACPGIWSDLADISKLARDLGLAWHHAIPHSGNEENHEEIRLRILASLRRDLQMRREETGDQRLEALAIRVDDLYYRRKTNE